MGAPHGASQMRLAERSQGDPGGQELKDKPLLSHQQPPPAGLGRSAVVEAGSQSTESSRTLPGFTDLRGSPKPGSRVEEEEFSELGAASEARALIS